MTLSHAVGSTIVSVTPFAPEVRDDRVDARAARDRVGEAVGARRCRRRPRRRSIVSTSGPPTSVSPSPPAADVSVAGAAAERVDAGAAVERVVAGAAVERVVAAVPVEGVVAARARSRRDCRRRPSPSRSCRRPSRRSAFSTCRCVRPRHRACRAGRARSRRRGRRSPACVTLAATSRSPSCRRPG